MFRWAFHTNNPPWIECTDTVTKFKRHQTKFNWKSKATQQLVQKQQTERSVSVVWVNVKQMTDISSIVGKTVFLIKVLLPGCSPPGSWAHRCLWDGNLPGQSDLPLLAAVDLLLHLENLCNMWGELSYVRDVSGHFELIGKYLYLHTFGSLSMTWTCI